MAESESSSMRGRKKGVHRQESRESAVTKQSVTRPLLPNISLGLDTSNLSFLATYRLNEIQQQQ